MNAPARFGDYSDRYDAALTIMAPFDQGDEVRRLRRRLMTSRDLASQALSASHAHSAEALSLYRTVLNVASSYCYRRDPVDDIAYAARLCLRLIQCAAALSRLEGGDDSPR